MPYTVTAPASEPFTKALVKNWLKLDASATDEDDVLDILIGAARAEAESTTNQFWASRTVVEYLDNFPETPLLLSVGKVRAFASIEYLPDGGDGSNYSTLNATNYKADIISDPARIELTETGAWPDTIALPNAVKITYTVGVSSVDDIPAPVKNAMLLRIGQMYENREDMKTKATERAVFSLLRGTEWRPQF